jgi:hypothetical protein
VSSAISGWPNGAPSRALLRAWENRLSAPKGLKRAAAPKPAGPFMSGAAGFGSFKCYSSRLRIFSIR